MKVASELGIPIFTILAPDRKTITPGLMPSQPWWDFDPTLPEEEKQQMRFMEQVADELMRRSDSGDSTCVNGGVKVGRVGGGLLSIGDQILYRLPSFIGL